MVDSYKIEAQWLSVCLAAEKRTDILALPKIRVYLGLAVAALLALLSVPFFITLSSPFLYAQWFALGASGYALGGLVKKRSGILNRRLERHGCEKALRTFELSPTQEKWASIKSALPARYAQAVAKGYTQEEVERALPTANEECVWLFMHLMQRRRKAVEQRYAYSGFTVGLNLVGIVGIFVQLFLDEPAATIVRRCSTAGIWINVFANITLEWLWRYRIGQCDDIVQRMKDASREEEGWWAKFAAMLPRHCHLALFKGYLRSEVDAFMADIGRTRTPAYEIDRVVGYLKAEQKYDKYPSLKCVSAIFAVFFVVSAVSLLALRVDDLLIFFLAFLVPYLGAVYYIVLCLLYRDAGEKETRREERIEAAKRLSLLPPPSEVDWDTWLECKKALPDRLTCDLLSRYRGV